MIAAIIGAVVGFMAGLVVALVFPIGFWLSRLLDRMLGPVEFKIGDETILLRHGDVLRWERVEEPEDEPPV